MPVSKDLIRAARRADLYQFLLSRHPDDIVQDAQDRSSIRLRDNHSVSIKRGYTGYKDWATGETGNSLDLLVRHLGYTLTDAVLALTGSVATLPVQQSPRPTTPQQIELPAPYAGRYRQLLAYLTQTRGLPVAVVQRTVSRPCAQQRLLRQLVVCWQSCCRDRPADDSVPCHRLRERH